MEEKGGHLDPDIAIVVNVITGRVEVSGTARGVRADPVVGIEDPVAGHRLFRYAGGVPGMDAGQPGPAGAAALPAAGALPVWGPPRLLSGRRLASIAFSDGRTVRVSSDRERRARSISWPGDGGGRLRASIRYAGSLTTVTDPFGVSRVYRHDRAGHAVELVPAAWRGPGYRRSFVPVLDDIRQTGWLQHRTAVQKPRVRDLVSEAGAAAGSALGGVWFEAATNGGFLNIGLASLSRAPHVNSVLARLGILDMTNVQSTLDTDREINRINSSLDRSFLPIARDCHLTWGAGNDVVYVTVADTITPPEVATIDRGLATVHAWAVIRRGGHSMCATAR
jgi:hypothetical protein